MQRNTMMLGDAIMLGNVVMFVDVLIALIDGNMILHFKIISLL